MHSASNPWRHAAVLAAWNALPLLALLVLARLS